MEEIFNNIKAFLLEKVNPLVAEAAEEGLSMPQFSENFIIFGQVDLSRYQNKIIVSVLPEEQTEEPVENLDSYQQNSSFTITFLCSGDTAEKLVKKMCRYSECFRKAILSDPMMNETCNDSALGDRMFYCDAGAVPGQMTAVEIGLTIFTSIEI